MSVLLCKLHQMPEDEAQDIRALLSEEGFATYETHAGFWGLGVSAIWLVDKAQLPEARALIDRYQAQRLVEQRQHYQEQVERGELPSLWRKVLSNPLRFLALLLAILVVLGVSIIPFWGMALQVVRGV